MKKVAVKFEFQFLMVRLKEFTIIIANQNFNISIPYGAIKRDSFANSYFTVQNISIPYGAIKRQEYQTYF